MPTKQKISSDSPKKAIARAFRERLDQLISKRSEEEDLQRAATEEKNARRLAIEELAEVIDEEPHTIENWLAKNNLSVPYAYKLVLIAKHFSTTVSWLLGEFKDDNVPVNSADSSTISKDEAIASHARYHFDAEREAIFKSAPHSLWIQLRSGKTLGSADPLIGMFEEMLLRYKPSVRLLICDPEKEAIKEMLAYRLRYSDTNQVAAEIGDTVNKVRHIAQKTGSTLEIGYCPYLYSALGYIANPPQDENDTSMNGRAVILMSGFNSSDLRDTLMVRASRAQNPHIFDFLVREYGRLWRFTQGKGRMEKI